MVFLGVTDDGPLVAHEFTVVLTDVFNPGTPEVVVL